MLSDQKTDSQLGGISSSSLSILSCRTETVAAESSKRGTEIAFKGATRDFPNRKEQ